MKDGQARFDMLKTRLEAFHFQFGKPVKSEKCTVLFPSRWKDFVCGEENARGFNVRIRVDHGAVVLDYVTQRTDAGYTHLVHGGVAMTLMDEVMTWAAIIASIETPDMSLLDGFSSIPRMRATRFAAAS